MLLPRGAKDIDGIMPGLAPADNATSSSSADSVVLSSLSSSRPTDSSNSTVVRPAEVKFSTLAGVLAEGPLPSKGSLDHGQTGHWVCAAFLRGHCELGRACHKCHVAGHDRSESSRGGGSIRQRAAIRKAVVREIRTPDAYD